MALLKNRPIKLDGAPIGGDRLDSILSRVQLVDIASLQRYEGTDPARVAQIEHSLQSTGVLINPVIVDPERQLLVDGHHRVQAFESLGLPRIPAFTVDYLSDDLTVKGWNHTTEATPEELLAAIEMPDDEPDDGPSSLIVADARCRELIHVSFESPQESAHRLNEFIMRLRQHGHTVTPRTEAQAVQLGQNHSYIRPVVGKTDVIKMVERGDRFPQEINRHLVDDRPLNLRVPVRASLSRIEFRAHIDRARDKSALAVGPGSREGERLYEERVTLFRTNYLRV